MRDSVRDFIYGMALTTVARRGLLQWALSKPWVCRALGCAPIRRPQQPQGRSFSVLSYNVNLALAGSGRILCAIRKADADIVCLQETTAAWETFLRGRLSAEYEHMLFMRSAGAGGMAALSRFPLEELAVLARGSGWFPKWILRAQAPGGTVQIVNLHLCPPQTGSGDATLGAVFATAAIRRREVEEVYPLIDPDASTVVLGDLNESDFGPAVRFLTARGYTDALGEFDRDSDTWQWRTRYFTIRGRFDHILYRKLRCHSAMVSPDGDSDHYPVKAVFQLADRT